MTTLWMDLALMMLYLEINNDIHTSGVKDEFGKYLDRQNSTVPQWVFDTLQEQTEVIEKIISAGAYKMRANFKKCFQIDSIGYEIKEDLEATGEYKVKFFSVFLNKYLFAKPDLKDYPRPSFMDRLRDFVDERLT